MPALTQVDIPGCVCSYTGGGGGGGRAGFGGGEQEDGQSQRWRHFDAVADAHPHLVSRSVSALLYMGGAAVDGSTTQAFLPPCQPRRILLLHSTGCLLMPARPWLVDC